MIEFVRIDPEAKLAEMISSYQEMTGQTVLPGSPEMAFLGWLCSLLETVYAEINNAGNQNIPSTATGENLTRLSELFGFVERPQPTAAKTQVMFVLDDEETASQAITIPAGTICTDENQIIQFATDDAVTIPSGSRYIPANVTCTKTGAIGNGFYPHQITRVIGTFAMPLHCDNTMVSYGGTDALDDAAFRRMLKDSLNYSVAGPRKAYEYLAKSVLTEYSDVRIMPPIQHISKTLTFYNHKAFYGGAGINVGTIVIPDATLNTDYTVSYSDDLLVITAKSGGSLYNISTVAISFLQVSGNHVDIYAIDTRKVPVSSAVAITQGSELGQKIMTVCNSENARPMTDFVSIKTASEVQYDISLTYFIRSDCTKSASEVAGIVSDAIDRYRIWQSEKIGRDINPSKLTQILMSTGVLNRIVVTNPTYQRLTDGSDGYTPQFSSMRSYSVICGGVEDE